MSVVMQISDHVVVLEYGRKISDGDPTFVKSDPKVIAAYLGVDDEEVGRCSALVISTKKPVRTSNWLARPRGGKADDLLLIRGIGPVNKRKLNEHGIFHFDQIAAWTRADIAAAEAYLEFDGRIDREDWIGQAAALAASGKRG
jgi:branched-chain amino acid transport system ATP-binding protein